MIGYVKIDWMIVGLIALVALLLINLYYAQLKKDIFDLRFLIYDAGTKQPSLHSVGQLIALLVSSWGFVYLTLHDKLSEMYFMGYMSAWAAASAVNKFLDNKNKPDDRDDNH